VVLVSWMREYEFWKQEARKGAGLDLERLRKEGRFAFVDGLSEVCLAPLEERDRGGGDTALQSGSDTVVPNSISLGLQGQRGSQTLPIRGPPGRIVPTRGPPQVPAQPTSPTTTIASTLTQTLNANRSTPGLYTLKSLDLAHLKTITTTAVSSLSSNQTTTSTTQRKTLILFDNPDLILALDPRVTPSAFISLVLTLHRLPNVSHILTHMQADNPLLSLSAPPQPLEIAHHNFLVKMAHMSGQIMGVRVLDTGVARDVSGVIRITEQKMGWQNLGFESGVGKGQEEGERGKEFLYQVKGDGSVKVFERGAGGE
jgi:elongator complex protein 6